MLDSLITSNRARAEKATPSAGKSVFNNGIQTISFGVDYTARPTVIAIIEANEYCYIDSWQQDADNNYTGVTLASSNGSSSEDFQYLIVPNTQ